MHISKKGLNLIKKWEGCYLSAYRDLVGVWTIGYGVTNADRKITGVTIRAGLKITKATADAWLVDCIRELYEPKVNKYMGKYHWNQNQFDALVSFAYNIGSIDQLTAHGARSNKEIALKILEYSKAGGKFVKGLYNRRKDEYNLFCAPVTTETEEKKESEYDMPVLKQGSEGKAVEIWQVIIGVKIDGIFGSETKKKTREFQKANGLTVDGIVGKYSWSAGLGSIA